MSDEKIAAAGVQRDPSVVVPDELALLPLRDTVLFPQSILPLAAGRPSSLNLIEDAVRGGHLIGVFTQRDPATEEPQGADLYRIGTLAAIHKVLKQPDGTVRLIVQGLARVRLVEVTQVRPYLKARVEEPSEAPPPAADLETEARVRNAATLFRQIVALSPLLPDELGDHGLPGHHQGARGPRGGPLGAREGRGADPGAPRRQEHAGGRPGPE